MKTNLPARRLIPKWRQVQRSLETQEAAALGKNSARSSNPARVPSTGGATELDIFNQDEFEQSVSLWEQFREPGVLGDILSFSMYPDLQEQVLAIGNRAIKSGAPVTAAQRFMIQQLGGAGLDQHDLLLPEPGVQNKEQVLPFAEPIKRLRALLRTQPSNPLALLDFAQLQAAIGRNEVAERALLNALGIAPSNRLIVRTLARFYVHAGEPDRAHLLLRRHARTASDPWLISTEIALADLTGSSSEFLAKGRRMLLDAGKSPSPHFTELAASIAMVELGAGNLKKARELQRIALIDPTDNVAAQAVDREHQFGIALNAPKVAQAIASSAEAKMLKAWGSFLPEAVESHALQWHNEEPFSSRPIQMLTAIFAFRGQVKRARNWLNVGLRSDPEDSGLMMNLAYIEARSGDIDKAKAALQRARRTGGEDALPYILANEAVVAYRLGHFDEGDVLYGRAVDASEARARRENLSTYCLLNQMVVAREFDHPRYDEIASRAVDAMRTRPNPEALMMVKVITEDISPESEMLPQLPGKEQVSPQRLTSQWIYDPKTNTLTEKKGLTASGAKPVVMLGDQQSRK